MRCQVYLRHPICLQCIYHFDVWNVDERTFTKLVRATHATCTARETSPLLFAALLYLTSWLEAVLQWGCWACSCVSKCPLSYKYWFAYICIVVCFSHHFVKSPQKSTTPQPVLKVSTERKPKWTVHPTNSDKLCWSVDIMCDLVALHPMLWSYSILPIY